jgi:hypothetical protein
VNISFEQTCIRYTEDLLNVCCRQDFINILSHFVSCEKKQFPFSPIPLFQTCENFRGKAQLILLLTRYSCIICAHSNNEVYCFLASAPLSSSSSSLVALMRSPTGSRSTSFRSLPRPRHYLFLLVMFDIFAGWSDISAERSSFKTKRTKVTNISGQDVALTQAICCHLSVVVRPTYAR